MYLKLVCGGGKRVQVHQCAVVDVLRYIRSTDGTKEYMCHVYRGWRMVDCGWMMFRLLPHQSASPRISLALPPGLVPFVAFQHVQLHISDIAD